MPREIPKHKGTDKLQAELKAKISKTKVEAEQHKKTAAKRGPSIKIPSQGAGRAILLGGPHAEKQFARRLHPLLRKLLLIPSPRANPNQE